MRMIDADAMKRKMRVLASSLTSPSSMTRVFIDCCIDAINNAPTIDAAPIHWTNIDETMPEIGVMVLMHRPPKFTAVMSLRYWDDRFWWENHRGEITEVYDNDYWMPLPEPPKEVTT